MSEGSRPHALLVAGIGTGALLLFLATERASRQWSYYSGYPILSLTLGIGMAATFLGYFILQRYPSVSAPLWRALPIAILLGAQICLAWLFLDFADGRMIFSDDHPSFLYRLVILQRHFPCLGLYNPEWNAGFPMTELPVVGVLGVFVLAWPLLTLVGDLGTLENSARYTLLIPYLYIFVIPWSIAAASKLLGFGRSTAALAGFLALGPTLYYFEWFLKYGTIGFSLSAGLFPFCFACCYRLALSERAPTYLHAVLSAFSAFIVLSWPMTGVVFIPLVALVCSSPNRLLAANRLPKVGVFLLLFLISFGPVFKAAVFESRASSIVLTESETHGQTKSGKKVTEKEVLPAWRRIAGPLLRFNPLIVVFLLPGLVLVRDRRLQMALSATFVWLFLLGGFADLLKPQLEFKRLFVHISFLATIVSALAVIEFLSAVAARRTERMLKGRLNFAGRSLLTAIVLGALLLSPLPVANAYLSRGDDEFVFAPKEVAELTAAIREFGGDGRTVFPSFLLHELGATEMNSQDGGHIAPLSLFTGKQMYAFHFFHVHWTGIDPIPESFRERGGAGIEDFLDLVNATSVVTINKIWRRHFGKLENYYPAYKGKRFRLYTRKSDKLGYFLKGSGEVQVKEQQLSVIAAEPDVVIKFRYYPRLGIDPALGELYPVPVFEEEVGRNRREQVNFIGLRATPRAIAERLPIELKF